LKYLNQIKKLEMSMFVENKRRCRNKRNSEIQYKEEIKNVNDSSNYPKTEKENFDDKNDKNDYISNISVTRLKKKNKISNIDNKYNNSKTNNSYGEKKKKVSLNGKKKNTKNKKKITKTLKSGLEITTVNNEHANILENKEEKLAVRSFRYNEPDSQITISDDEDMTFSSKKMMRSLRYNQNKVNEYYEIYRNSESVNKPLKSLKKRRKVKKSEPEKEEGEDHIINNECI
jgi:hypothetical protein